MTEILTASSTKSMQANAAGASTDTEVRPSAMIARVTCYADIRA